MQGIINKTYCHPKREDAVFSILIPTWNNLAYLKLCIESIRKHSTYKHQIIVHVNEGKDGTLDWVAAQPDIDYTFSKENIGVCYALNACRPLVSTSYILYMNDDMYACPNWDSELYKNIREIGHPYFFISATAIEPVPQSNCAIGKNYGTDISAFNEAKLLEEYNTLTMQDWSGASWPPNVVHKDIWDLVGGYSIEFSPGMYSDPDFSVKLWTAGVRIFKGVAASRVYHFGSVSTKRIVKNKGYYMFISKWGFTQSLFSNYFLKRGEPYTGPLSAPNIPVSLKLKNWFKQLQSLFIHAR